MSERFVQAPWWSRIWTRFRKYLVKVTGEVRSLMRLTANKESQLHREVCNWVATIGEYAVLRELSLVMLMPQNQRTELRFLHLAELILSNFQQAGEEKKSQEAADLDSVGEMYDGVYGAYFPPMESDFVNIPYVSWIDWKDGVYRVVSGTFADSELYLKDVISKGCSLDESFSERFGFSFGQVLDLMLPRIHQFISAVHGDESDQETINDSLHHWQFLQLDDATRQAFDSYMVFPKGALSHSESAMLRLLSKTPTDYSPDLGAIFEGNSVVMKFPVVELADRYVLAFPQLLIPAILDKVQELTNRIASPNL